MDPAPILVFQCRGCLTIVGDTYAFVRADKNSGTVTLSAASNVSHGTAVVEDGDVSFHELCCSHCTATIGRVNAAAPKGSSRSAGTVTLSTSAIKTYELGVNTHRTKVGSGGSGCYQPPCLPCDASAGPTAQHSACNSLSPVAGASFATRQRCIEEWCKSQFQSSAAELVKVKNMILVLNERLTAVEERRA